MVYKENLNCMLCSKDLNINDARIEWLRDMESKEAIEIYICHKQCIDEQHTYKYLASGFDIIEGIYGPVDIKNRLDELENKYPYLSKDITTIKKNVI